MAQKQFVRGSGPVVDYDQLVALIAQRANQNQPQGSPALTQAEVRRCLDGMGKLLLAKLKQSGVCR